MQDMMIVVNVCVCVYVSASRRRLSEERSDDDDCSKRAHMCVWVMGYGVDKGIE